MDRQEQGADSGAEYSYAIHALLRYAKRYSTELLVAGANLARTWK
jgi:hypothetical protein